MTRKTRTKTPTTPRTRKRTARKPCSRGAGIPRGSTSPSSTSTPLLSGGSGSGSTLASISLTSIAAATPTLAMVPGVRSGTSKSTKTVALTARTKMGRTSICTRGGAQGQRPSGSSVALAPSQKPRSAQSSSSLRTRGFSPRVSLTSRASAARPSRETEILGRPKELTLANGTVSRLTRRQVPPS